MFTLRRHELTDCRSAARFVASCLAVASVIGVAPIGLEAQRLPFAVSIVDWDRAMLDRQRRAFRSEAADHEVLFCIESWTATIVAEGVERVVITGVRRERAGTKNEIRDVGSACVGKDGLPLPMFHTHSDGNCQLSPNDLVALVARSAAFEGVQCGERHFVWAFAWQVAAIATAVELTRLRQPSASPSAPLRNSSPDPPR